MENNGLPYIPLEDFEIKVAEYAKVNNVLRALFNNPKFKSWEQLPHHLKLDLFNRLGCKPSMQKY